jgi:hypothetical protein
MPYDAESNIGLRLRNDGNNRTRGSGRSADAVPGIPATAQRRHRGLETGDESPATGALRSIISCLLSRGATLKYADNNRESCDISVQLLNQVEGYHREAVQARGNACAGRPLRLYPADIVPR